MDGEAYIFELQRILGGIFEGCHAGLAVLYSLQLGLIYPEVDIIYFPTVSARINMVDVEEEYDFVPGTLELHHFQFARTPKCERCPANCQATLIGTARP